MDTLRVLLVGNPADSDQSVTTLSAAGHAVITVENLSAASEALEIQRFDAVVLAAAPAEEVPAFVAKVRAMSRSGSATANIAVLSTVPGLANAVDGLLPRDADAESLTLAIARLAHAVRRDLPSTDTELPILDVEELREQVAFDDELLVELIDLYLSEREKQSFDMQDAFANGELDRLSRIAHTIKGSLGSLHAMRAKQTAQGLESAARDKQYTNSERYLNALERELDELNGRLVALRNSLSQR